MSRNVSIAHSKSILNRQRHVMSIGLENQGLWHYDINITDSLNRYNNLKYQFEPDKWEFVDGSASNIEIKEDGTAVITGVTGTITLVSKDYVEIDTNQNYYMLISLMNVSDSGDANRVNAGTVDYTDLSTQVTAGRPSGVDYDKWCLNNATVSFDSSDTLVWKTYVNDPLSTYPGFNYKTGESGDPLDLDKWPTNTTYARLFVQIKNLTSGMIFHMRDLQLFFKDAYDVDYDQTPKTYLLDKNAGRFGGAVELAGQTTNMVWNGNLLFGVSGWSVGIVGSGSVTSSLDDDGSFKVYFEEIQNIRNIVQIDMPNEIAAATDYTLSFYARATIPMGFRRIEVINATTDLAGWESEEIVYVNNIWQKIVTTATSKNIVTSDMNRIIITEPDVLEPETLFVYYNGVLLQRGVDYTEFDNSRLEFSFQTSSDDIINICSQMPAAKGETAFKIEFHDYIESGNKVQIRHLEDTGNPGDAVAVEEIYQITSPTTQVQTNNYIVDSVNGLHVYENGQLLEETVDYNLTDIGGKWRIDFTYLLLVNDVIKVIFWDNISITRYEYTSLASQTDFDLPTGITYSPDGKHLLVYVNGVCQTVLDDYAEIDSNTIRFGTPLTVAKNVTICVIDSPYEYETDQWDLLVAQKQFMFDIPEPASIFRMVFENGKAMSEDQGTELFDYDTGTYTVTGDSFYYEIYDLTPASGGQTVFVVPGGWDVGDDLYVYRNGLMQTEPDDYASDQSSGSVTFILQAYVGELITFRRYITTESTGPDSKQLTREDYVLDEDITEYKTSQTYGFGDDSLRLYINGVVQREGTDYNEDADGHTITIISDISTGSTAVVIIAVALGAETPSLYLRETHYSDDVDSNGLMETVYNTNYIQDTTGAIWIKNVKLEAGTPYKDSYSPGVIQTIGIEYNPSIDERESTLTYFIKPYSINLIDDGVIDYQGEVASYSNLPGGASAGEVYRTLDTYRYYEWAGSWVETLGPTAMAMLYETTGDPLRWSLYKLERVMDQDNQFKVIVGEPNNYNIITLPELDMDDWTMMTNTWSLLGVQWFQQEVATESDLPALTGSEDGFVYKVLETGDYWIWDGGHWDEKAPNASYTKYSGLPTLDVWHDGYVAIVTQEPENYQGSTGSLPPIFVAMEGWVYLYTGDSEYYIADWDYVLNTGTWRKISVNYYYQWQWDPVAQTGTWEQSNSLKVYLNAGAEGIYTKTYRSVAYQPNRMVISNNLFGKIDEMRLDTVNRDPREVLAWYDSQEPFYPRGYDALIV